MPFRNSKLTYLLEDVLSGDSKVMMLAMVSPAVCNVQETLCTMTFAERTAAVNLRATRGPTYNLDALKKSQIRCKSLETQVEELTRQLQLAGRPPSRARRLSRNGVSGGSGADSENTMLRSSRSPRLRRHSDDTGAVEPPPTPFEVKARKIHRMLSTSAAASCFVTKDKVGHGATGAAPIPLSAIPSLLDEVHENTSQSLEL